MFISFQLIIFLVHCNLCCVTVNKVSLNDVILIRIVFSICPDTPQSFRLSVLEVFHTLS